jgi:hypothetical protein
MLCETFYKQLGYDCDIAVTSNGESGMRICTPIDFTDGAPFYFFITTQQNQLLTITDNGDTIFHFMSLGLINNHRKSWKSIRHIAEKSGLMLTEHGEVMALFQDNQQTKLMSSMMEFGYALKAWEQERLGHSLTDLYFIDEVEMALRAWNSKALIEKNPTIKGYSHKSYHFDLSFDNTYVDALQPNARSTGSKLRKIIDLQKGPVSTKLLFVLDDRSNPDLAQMERDLIGGVSTAMLYSDLIKLGSNPLENTPHQ